MNDLCLLLPLSGILPSKSLERSRLFPSVAIGVMAPLIGHGWPKGNPLMALFAPSALKINPLENGLKAMQSKFIAPFTGKSPEWTAKPPTLASPGVHVNKFY